MLSHFQTLLRIKNLSDLLVLINLTGLIFILSWATLPIGAIISYRQQTPRDRRSLRAFLRYCFPRDLLIHRSFRLDVFNVLLLNVMRPIAMAPILLGQASVVSITHIGLVAMLGAPDRSWVADMPWPVLMLIYIFLLETVSFHVHYLEHKLAVLWELHKVHHSVEKLVLVVSTRRSHPLEEIVSGALTAIGVGVPLGIMAYAGGFDLKAVVVDSSLAYAIANALSFHHLRHSHFALEYGWLERYLLSPRQHHIHHAYDTHLWDRNFGWLLAFWDRAYGTISYSAEARQFNIGLPREQQEKYDSLVKMMVWPLINLAMLAHGWVRRSPRADQAQPLADADLAPPGTAGDAVQTDRRARGSYEMAKTAA